MNAIEIDKVINEFRARVKALRIKGWNKNVWAVETEAEEFIQELLLYTPQDPRTPNNTPPRGEIG